MWYCMRSHCNLTSHVHVCIAGAGRTRFWWQCTCSRPQLHVWPRLQLLAGRWTSLLTDAGIVYWEDKYFRMDTFPANARSWDVWSLKLHIHQFGYFILFIWHIALGDFFLVVLNLHNCLSSNISNIRPQPKILISV